MVVVFIIIACVVIWWVRNLYVVVRVKDALQDPKVRRMTAESIIDTLLAQQDAEDAKLGIVVKDVHAADAGLREARVAEINEVLKGVANE